MISNYTPEMEEAYNKWAIHNNVNRVDILERIRKAEDLRLYIMHIPLDKIVRISRGIYTLGEIQRAIGKIHKKYPGIVKYKVFNAVEYIKIWRCQ